MNIKKNLLILGAGQFGRVAKEVAESMDCFDKIAFLDDNHEKAIGRLGDYEKYFCDYSHAFVAIGNADLRLAFIRKLEERNFAIEVLVSPKAFVSRSAQLGRGTIVEPMAVVNANSLVGIGVFVCAGSVLNHDSSVGDGCQIDCGSVVGANAILPAKTKLKYNEVFTKDCDDGVKASH